MSATIEITAAVARQGKTDRLLQQFRHALTEVWDNRLWGTTLWLAPTQRARRDVLSRLIDDSLPVVFAPNVFTFDGFAEAVLKSSGANVTALSSVARKTLLRSIVADMQQRGDLSYFSPIAQTSGFLDLLGAFVSELKRDEIWPEQFVAACQERGVTDKDRELAAIYQRYQQQLVDLGLYDAEGRFWSARTTLDENPNRPFDRLSLVVVDGFTDFTHTQYEILAHLAANADRLIVSLPLEHPLERGDLFAKVETARRRIEGLANDRIRVETDRRHRRPDTNRPAFDHIADQLFANPRALIRSADATGVEILAATGQLGEVEAVAERVKLLLLGGERPDDIVIAVRSLDDYAPLIDEVATAAGIPYWCEAGLPLARTPVIKTLFAVLQLEQENWPFERLAAVLDNSGFRPDWDECRDRRAVRAVATTLCRLKIHADRRAMLRVLDRMARHEQTAREEQRHTAVAEGQRAAAERSAIGSAHALLQKLETAMQALRTPQTLADWAQTLIELANALGIAPRRSAESDTDRQSVEASDWRAWDLFRRSLSQAVEMTALCDRATTRIDLTDLLLQLKELVLPEAVTPARDERGRVRVLEAAAVRSLDVRHLFVVGLTEQSFPRPGGDDCLYNEAERHSLNDKGLTLGHRSAHSQDEMLLFYSVVTRARQSLVLSYPALSGRGQPLFPSPYVGALRDLFEPAALPITPVGQLDPVPARERIHSSGDLRLVATNELAANRPALFRGMAEAGEYASTALNILAAVDVATLRFTVRGFTPVEGILENPRHLDRLRQRFSPAHEFSATQLESYANCPFKFFLSEVLKISPNESPRAETDYLKRGILVHEVLAALHRELAADTDSDPDTVGAGQPVAARFQQMVSERLGRRIRDTELQQVLAEIEEQLLHDWADAYAEQCDTYRETFGKLWDAPPKTARLETPFGDVPEEAGDVPKDWFDSLRIGPSDQPVRIRGRIDRIDVGRVENQPVFNVIDYKTGGPPKFNLAEVQSGSALQLALYTLAVRRMQLAGGSAEPFQMGYWCIRETGFVSGLKGRVKRGSIDPAVLQSIEAALEQVIPELVASMRGGQFPVDSRNPDCTGRCPYRTVCRVTQIRPLAESLDKHRPPPPA